MKVYKKSFLTKSETLMGPSSTLVFSTLSIGNPSIGIPIANSSALITSIDVLITIEYISKLKTRCTMIRDWINLISLLYENTLEQAMVDAKIDEKEAIELKKVCKEYLERRTDIMKRTQFKMRLFLVKFWEKIVFRQKK